MVRDLNETPSCRGELAWVHNDHHVLGKVWSDRGKQPLNRTEYMLLFGHSWGHFSYVLQVGLLSSAFHLYESITPAYNYAGARLTEETGWRQSIRWSWSERADDVSLSLIKVV